MTEPCRDLLDAPDWQDSTMPRAWRPRCTRLVILAVVLAPWSLVLGMILWVVNR